MAEILIVDDEASVREMLVGRIEKLGHRCTEAADGQKALERLREREYDMILCDVVMPRLNGFDLLTRIALQIRERIPFVILSSHDDVEGVEASIYAGAFDYVLKPGKDHEIKDVVTRALARRQEWLSRDPAPRGGLTVSWAPAPAAPPRNEPTTRGVPALAKERRIVAIAAPSSAPPRLDTKAGRRRGFLRAVRSLFGR